MTPIKDGTIPVKVDELSELIRKANAYDAGESGTINPKKHGMVIVLDGALAKVFDEGQELRYVTEFKVEANRDEIAEVTLTKLATNNKDGLSWKYGFESIGDD